MKRFAIRVDKEFLRELVDLFIVLFDFFFILRVFILGKSRVFLIRKI